MVENAPSKRLKIRGREQKGKLWRKSTGGCFLEKFEKEIEVWEKGWEHEAYRSHYQLSLKDLQVFELTDVVILSGWFFLHWRTFKSIFRSHFFFFAAEATRRLCHGADLMMSFKHKGSLKKERSSQKSMRNMKLRILK